MDRDVHVAITIVGIGSPLGYDRAGWWSVEYLRQHAIETVGPVSIRLEVCDRPGVDLLGSLQNAEMVVLIDAVCTNALPAGHLIRLAPEELSCQAGLVSCHGFGVAEALRLGAVLGLLPPRLVIFGIVVPAAADVSESLPLWWPSTMLSLREEVTAAVEQMASMYRQPTQVKL